MEVRVVSRKKVQRKNIVENNIYSKKRVKQNDSFFVALTTPMVYTVLYKGLLNWKERTML